MLAMQQLREKTAPAWSDDLPRYAVGADDPLVLAAVESATSQAIYYYRARYYDPKLGRFISEDPSGLADGPNLFLYVHGNPIRWTDPTGLSRYIPPRSCPTEDPFGNRQYCDPVICYMTGATDLERKVMMRMKADGAAVVVKVERERDCTIKMDLIPRQFLWEGIKPCVLLTNPPTVIVPDCPNCG